MACQTAKRKKYQSRKGLLKAAEILGVDYSHLRRVVIGQRPGKSLMKRYQDFKKGKLPVQATEKPKYHNSPAPMPPSLSVAAAQNLSPEFFAVLTKLGLEVVIVRFDAGKDSPIWRHPQIEQALGAALNAAQCGHYDSTHYDTGVFYHFFHVNPLATAMQTLKAAIEARGLLEITTIMHGESCEDLRIWYPATADHISAKLP